ncbi:MAG TPA: STAS domain-containing protein [Gaiellales bacterium]|nr:STAS domain-containing protein [Gaiellales bacterium]
MNLQLALEGTMMEGPVNPLEIRMTDVAQVVRLDVRGELCVSTAPDLEAAVSRSLATSARTLHLDLRAVDFCDLAGLRALSAVADRCEGRKVTLAVDGSASIRGVTGLLESVTRSDAA